MAEESGVKWKARYGKHQFEGVLSLHLEYGAREDTAIHALKTGLGCLKCRSAKALGPCQNCNSEAYQLGLNTSRVVGLFCTQCKRGFSSFECDCGCTNPISHETIVTVDSGGCFVATAAAGSVDAFEVRYLSQFRDMWLTTSRAGRLVVATYYRISPPIACFIARSELLRWFALKGLVQPVVSMMRRIVGDLQCR